jgi:trigger factor
MQVSVEKTSELSRKMTVSVPEAVIQEKVSERLKSIMPNVKVNGFRPGKVPSHVVNKMYGSQIRYEVAGELIQSTYYEALQSQQLNPIGQPTINPVDGAEGFEYTAVFEVLPEVSLAGLELIEVTRPVASIEEADVDAVIEKLRVQRTAWQPVNRAVQLSDRVTLDFSGEVEGENFTDGLVQNYSVDIGANQMIPGFEDQLLGLEVGANKTFDLAFPDAYGNAKLAGKTAQFAVTIIAVAEPSVPEIDAEFIKSYGVAEGTADSFREDVKKNMARELAEALRSKLRTTVVDVLYETCPIAVPTALVDEDIESRMKQYLEESRQGNIEQSGLEMLRSLFAEQAKRRIAVGLILGEIIQQNGLQLDHDKVRIMIEDLAGSYENPQEVIDWYYTEKERLQEVQQLVLEEQAVQWLLARAKVSEETLSFSDAVARQQ